MNQPAANPYALTAWGAPKLVDLECPSGQLCQVRPAGVEQLITAGVLESVDTLTSLIDSKHIKRVQGKQTPAAKKKAEENSVALPDGQLLDKESLLKDKDNLIKVFGLVDKVAVAMVVQPQVLPVPDNPEHRAPMDELGRNGQVYTDMIDMMDKMFIFQYAVGGGTDLESFRQQFAGSMGGLASK